MGALIKRLFARLFRKRGQALVEYGLIMALIVIVLVVALTNMGKALADFFNYVSHLLTETV